MPTVDEIRTTRFYRVGLAVAVVTSLLTIWVTIVREDGTELGYFMLILAAGVGALAAWFSPSGMARAMLGVTAMQILLAVLIATAPSTANMPDGGARALMFAAVFAALWLTSAGLFQAAAKTEVATVAV